MNNHQKKPKFKASTSEFVGPLLNRLKLAKEKVPKNPETEEIINQIIKQVGKKKDILDSIGDWDIDLVTYFGQIERKIDEWIDYNYKMTEWIEPTIPDLLDILKQLSENQKVNPPKIATKTHEKASGLPQKATTEVGEPSNRSYQEKEISIILKWIESVGPQAMSYLYSLAIFPEDTVLKKRFLIYWWIGLGLASFWDDRKRTAEHLGEVFFSGLVKKGVLIPVHREHNRVIDLCTIHPIIFKQLTSDYERKHLISFVEGENGIWELHNNDDSLVVHNTMRGNTSLPVHMGLLNLKKRYLNSTTITNNDDLLVVQLGRCHYKETEDHDRVEEDGSGETKLEGHIEVDETDFLKKMGANVTYLSLQGISRIDEIPESIGKLQHLLILDLRACHNLEKLPEKSNSTLKPNLTRWTLNHKTRWFENLMIFDISECYLLDHMPKWLCELSNLEVLKGFVVSGVRSKTQSCQVGDLSKLKKLRKLSIRISSDQLVKEDFSGLKDLDRLLILTIIWRDNKKNSSLSQNNKSNDTIPTYSFPKNLEKLDIRCYPEAEASNLLNPTKLTNLKRLYIRGGKLIKIPYNDKWKVEILRLRFLENLKTDWVELKDSFENLKYVEYVTKIPNRTGELPQQCPELENFPNNVDGWIIQKSVTIHEKESVFCYQYRADTPVDNNNTLQNASKTSSQS